VWWYELWPRTSRLQYIRFLQVQRLYSYQIKSFHIHIKSYQVEWSEPALLILSHIISGGVKWISSPLDSFPYQIRWSEVSQLSWFFPISYQVEWSELALLILFHSNHVEWSETAFLILPHIKPNGVMWVSSRHFNQTKPHSYEQAFN